MIHRIPLVVTLLLCVGLALAGEKKVPEGVPETAPAWTAHFDGSIAWQRVSPVGTLIVGTGAGLYGVDPLTGNRIWHEPGLRGLAAESYQPILNSPFVLLSDDGEQDRIVILDAMTGRLIFESQSAGIRQVLSTHMLPESQGLLVFGIREGKTAMLLLDIPTGKTRRVNDDILACSGGVVKFATTLMQSLADHSGVVYDPLEIGDEAFLISSGTGVHRVDATSGKFEWQVQPVMGAGRTRLYRSPDHPEIYFAASEVESSGSSTSGLVYTYYSAHKITDGSKAWPKPIKLKGSANDVIFLDQGVVVASAPDGSGKVKLIDYASGKSVWGKKGKGLDVPGSVVDHALLDAGLLLATGKDSVWTRSGADYLFTLVDPASGSLRFPKPLKVKGRLLYTEQVAGGVLFVTTSQVDIVDPSTGRARLEHAVVSDGSLVVASRADRLYAFSQRDGALYTVDRKTSKLELLSKDKIKFGDKDVAEALEVTDETITVLSGQNVVTFDHQGELKFHVHYPAPKHPAALRALYGALAFRAAMASAASGVYSGAFAGVAADQEQGSAGHVVAQELSRGYGELAEGYAGLSGDYFRAMNARFRESERSSDFAFMMTRFPGEGIGLAGVSKETGAIVSKIDLGQDREPEYEVDAVANRVYYKTGANTLAGYAF